MNVKNVVSMNYRLWKIFIIKKCLFDISELTVILFIMPLSRFDNTLYFDITLTPNGMIVL